MTMRRPQHQLYHRPGSGSGSGSGSGGILGVDGAGAHGSYYPSYPSSANPLAWLRYLRARVLGGPGDGDAGAGGSGASASSLPRRLYGLLAVMVAGLVVVHVTHRSLASAYQAQVDRAPQAPYGSTYTIRVNTFRRNDLLKGFLRHFTTCPNVQAVQVVWSDQENAPPPLGYFELPSAQQEAKVQFEVQPTDSLNNRFRALLPIETPAVLSLDDDLEIPCESLDFAHSVWQASPQSLVGFTPRLATWDAGEQGYRYQSSFKMVWWHGLYNIVLTKCCFLHRDYLAAYFEALSPETLAYIDERRNCEDLAMQFVVSNATGGVPPVWVRARFTDRGVKIGISQGKDHEQERSDCLNRLAKEFGRFSLTLTSHKAMDARQQWFW